MSVIKEYRTVSEVVGPLMIVDQVEGVHYNELVEIKLHDGTTPRGKASKSKKIRPWFSSLKDLAGSTWKKPKSALPDVP